MLLQLKPNRQRAKNAITFIWIVFALNMLIILFSIIQLIYGESFDIRKIIDKTWLLSFDLIYLSVYVASVVTFIQWFRRAYYNLNARIGNTLSRSDGWVAGSWFIPFVNLYLPFKLMREMYEETDKYLVSRGNETYKAERLGTGDVYTWWTLVILYTVKFSITSSGTKKSFLTIVTNEYIALAINTILFILLTILTIIVIQNYSKLELLLVEEEVKDNNMKENYPTEPTTSLEK
ncbi:DUF4328 domain-containing protein [Dysgonomonas sp. 520]|uniref:DUF4328 domain-containing protein n=1 Tax=Dysgonomonas sp. 520 TaxID=2302931 RepID=UPI001C88BF6C|nr:DUF4328 domain-containing protein [Dysgonomonas sp. 520]NDW09079.1 DUF4328 domain-containing protein [Dysgonomonas sp. 520]